MANWIGARAQRGLRVLFCTAMKQRYAILFRVASAVERPLSLLGSHKLPGRLRPVPAVKGPAGKSAR